MKIMINQNVLASALDKGALAAVLNEAQSNTSNLSLLIKSIKITVDNNFTIESSIDLMAIKHYIPATKENGIEVEEQGCVVIPAKEFIDWVKIQGSGSTIYMSLSKLETPEIINTASDLDVSDDKHDYTLKKIGSVKMVAKDAVKTSSKWELDCYDPKEFAAVNFKEKSEKHFDIQAKQLTEALNKIMKAAAPQDYEHILDSASIQAYQNKLYFAATDTKRCAVYQVPKENVSNIESNDPLLIPLNFLTQASKISDEKNTLSFSYNSDIERVFIKQPNLDIRVASAEKGNIKKFPDIKVLLDKDYKLLAEAPRTALVKALMTAAIVNKSSALFSFKKDDKTLTLKAISEDGRLKPVTTKAKTSDPSSELTAIWGVGHLIDALQIIKEDVIQLHIPDNLKSVKIMGKDDKSFMYFAMIINNPIYNAEDK